MSKTDFSTLPSLYREIAAPLKKTEERIMTMIRSENGDIEAAAKYLLNSGGKRLRPALLLLLSFPGFGTGCHQIICLPVFRHCLHHLQHYRCSSLPP